MQAYLLIGIILGVASSSGAFQFHGPRQDLTCPEPDEVGDCVELCKTSEDCSEEVGELCCSNGCGHQCTPGVPVTEFDDCELECDDGLKCANYRPICWGEEDCPMSQTCVPEDFLGCIPLDCLGCHLQEVVCVTEPCYPVPECGTDDGRQ